MNRYIKILYIVLLFLAIQKTSQAQHPFCGTKLTQSQYDYYINNQSQVENFAATSSKTDFCIPIKFIKVKRTDGTGATVSKQQIENAISNLNTLFAPAGISFKHCANILSFRSDDYFDLDLTTVPTELVALNNYSVQNVLNVFLVNSIYLEDVDGNPITDITGITHNPDNIYAFPLEHVVVNYSSLNDQVTLPHEIGHYLSLFHTHEKNYSGAELVDRVTGNCGIAGDLLCGTPADPDLTGVVDVDCNYVGTDVDLTGLSYTPMVENIMSYAPYDCKTSFTNDQYARMVGGLNIFRNNLINCDDCDELGDTEDEVEICYLIPDLRFEFDWDRIGLSVDFDPYLLGDGVDDIDSYYWDFGDGTVSTSKNPSSITYNSTGSYKVTFYVIKDSDSCKYSRNVEVANDYLTNTSACTSNEMSANINVNRGFRYGPVSTMDQFGFNWEEANTNDYFPPGTPFRFFDESDLDLNIGDDVFAKKFKWWIFKLADPSDILFDEKGRYGKDISYPFQTTIEDPISQGTYCLDYYPGCYYFQHTFQEPGVYFVTLKISNEKDIDLEPDNVFGHNFDQTESSCMTKVIYIADCDIEIDACANFVVGGSATGAVIRAGSACSSGAYPSILQQAGLITPGELTVPPDRTVIFSASDEIILGEGVHIQEGSDFLGQLKACNPYELAANANKLSDLEKLIATDKTDHTSLLVTPNPSSEDFHFQLNLGKDASTQMVIYNIMGGVVAELVTGNLLTTGSYQFSWDTQNVPAGIYFCKVHSGKFIHTERLILTK